MAISIYLFSTAISILALSGWFFGKNNTLVASAMQLLTGTAVLVLLGSSFFLGLDAESQFRYLLADMFLLAGTGMAGIFLSKRRGNYLSAVAAILMLIFPLHRGLIFRPGNGGLDKDAEILLALDPNTEVLDGFQLALEKWNLRAKPAFDPLSPERTGLDDYLVVDVPEKWEKKVEQILADLQQTEGVRWVEPNEVMLLDDGEGLTVNRENPSMLNDPGRKHLWGFELMEMEQLYRLLQNQKLQPHQKALIVILDSGVDSGHEDIKGNYVSLDSRWDSDPLGHGTHCAGIAAAVSNNGKGVASFSLQNDFVEVSSIKVLNGMGSGTQKAIIDGIITAADRGAAVISMSLGGRSSQKRQEAYREAVAYAAQKGSIVVAAAGNANANAKTFAPVNAPGIIGVAALDTLAGKAGFSNTVQDIAMGLSAPGVNIYSTIPNDEYASFNGTSMATPYVAGLLGLMKSLQPELDAKTAFRILSESGKTTRDQQLTGKMILPHKAIRILLEERTNFREAE